jgi:hypothetical protein
MAVKAKSFWADVFSLPAENESYLRYVATLKFLWAPVVFFFSSIWSLFTTKKEEQPPGTNLYHRDELQHTDPSLIDKEEHELMVQQFAQDPFTKDEMANTPLTFFLAMRVFNSSSDYMELHHQEVITLLAKLGDLAKTSKAARDLLITANNQNVALNPSLIKNGMPSNTPLMLLVKAGDSEAIRLILPFYSAEELMRPTPRGNSVFHIAAITGQHQVLSLLKNRAEELNIWQRLKSQQNKAGYTAYDMLEALFSRQAGFKNILDFSDPLLGGEEINKVAASDHGQKSVYQVRSRELKDFYRQEEVIEGDHKESAVSGARAYP